MEKSGKSLALVSALLCTAILITHTCWPVQALSDNVVINGKSDAQPQSFTEGGTKSGTFTVVPEVPYSKALEKLETDKESRNPELKHSSNLSEKGTASIKKTGEKEDDATGKPLESIKAFIEVAKSGINNLTPYLVDVGDGIQEIYFDYEDDEGNKHTSMSGIYYDEEKQLLYGKDDTGIYALGFDFDIRHLTIYAAQNCWNRNMGFMELYDYLAPLVNYDYLTLRVKFEYAKKDWLIQFWKGRYIITMGAEVGIYNKPQDRLIDFYDCAGDEDMMPMSMRLKLGNAVLIDREMQLSWWQTGFRLGPLYPPFMLTLESTIVFPNGEMRKAFTDSVDKLVNSDTTYTVDGNTVSLIW